VKWFRPPQRARRALHHSDNARALGHSTRASAPADAGAAVVHTPAALAAPAGARLCSSATSRQPSLAFTYDLACSVPTSSTCCWHTQDGQRAELVACPELGIGANTAIFSAADTGSFL